MCLIIHYTCQICKQKTGQRDYLRHTDGQRFPIPDPEMEIFSFCPYIHHWHIPVNDPLLQSPEFPCKNSACAGLKVHFNASKCKKQQERMFEVLQDTEYRIVVEGNGYMDVEAALKHEGINMNTDMWKLPGAKLQKWTVYTEDKIKKMAACGHNYNEMKIALKAITGLTYTTHQIITKAASLDLYQALFPEKRAKRSKSKHGAWK